ncbi:hypothetical protein SLA2020_048720 [Shorea laevis]
MLHKLKKVMRIQVRLDYGRREVYSLIFHIGIQFSRHNIDVMHTEKNVGVNFVGTMLGVEGVSKDNLKSRLDLVNMGIRHELHPKPTEDGRTCIPDVQQLEVLKSHVVLALCHLEQIFPPSFFTIMFHLVIHLANEAKVAGPIPFRWMYPIER